MLVRAHAKINLLLSVTPGLDEGGYHRVDTIMCPLELCDLVSVEASADAGVRLTCAPDPLPPGIPCEKNVAYRAAVAMGERFGRDLAYDVAIEKRIPSQAGLGGGSSDAAAVIRALAALWGVDPLDERLVEVAAGIGADVPFFLCEVPTLLVGRGDVPKERFAAFSVPVVLVKPPVGVSTAEAYRTLDALAPSVPGAQTMARLLRAGDVAGALTGVANNMEGAARLLCPDLVEVGEFLCRQPSLRHGPLLCGSGSCMAAFVDDDADAERIAASARGFGWWSTATRTLA